MKISKKVLSMVLCGFIVFGGSQASLIKAHAQSSTHIANFIPNEGEWRQRISFKLRAKWNILYKAWWNIDLVYKNGKLRLEGPTNIPGNLTFDDTFVFRWMDNNNREIKTITRFRPSTTCSAGDALNRAIILFNQAGINYSDYIFLYGENWNDTFEYAFPNSVIKQKSKNEYSKGFHNVDRFWTGFRVLNDGLEETIFN